MKLHIYCKIFPCVLTIFTSQPNLVIESGVHSFLHSSCNYQIIFAKFNLKICYPPPYSRQVWHFKEVETDVIRRAVNDFNWERAFSNTNVNQKVCIFNKSVLNVLSNFIPHGLSLGLSLFYRPKIKCSKIIERKKNIKLLNKLNCLQERLNWLITKSKNNYYEHMASQLNNSKPNWSLFKIFFKQ